MITTLVCGVIVLAILAFILLGFTASLQSQINTHERVLRLNGQSVGELNKALGDQQKLINLIGQDVQKKFRALENILGPCTCSSDPMEIHPDPSCPMHGM